MMVNGGWLGVGDSEGDEEEERNGEEVGDIVGLAEVGSIEVGSDEEDAEETAIVVETTTRMVNRQTSTAIINNLCSFHRREKQWIDSSSG